MSLVAKHHGKTKHQVYKGRSGMCRQVTSDNSVSKILYPEGPVHPAAKGVRQKEFGKKVTKKVTEASEKVTKK